MTPRKLLQGTTIALLVLFVGLSGCRPKAPVEPEPNTLTAEEEAEGWQLLFDGQEITKWRGFQRADIPSKWVIDDNAIHFTGAEEGEGGDIITIDQYDNFELELDWKIGECGNSGIIYRVVEGEHRAPWETGPEMQVLDNTCHPDAQNGPDRYAGANYAIHPVPAEVAKPGGEWNHVRLVVNGNHVEHWLNGEKIVEYELGSDDWKQRVAASKFNEMPGYGMATSGHIALQDHGDPVWYRNIKIRPLGGQEPPV